MSINKSMDPKALVAACRALGCCAACCLRYLGVKSPAAYEDPKQFLLKYEPEPVKEPTNPTDTIKNAVTISDISVPISKTDPVSVDPTTTTDSNSKPDPISVNPSFRSDPNSADPSTITYPITTSKPDPASIDPTSNSNPATIVVTPPTVDAMDTSDGSKSPPHKRRRMDVCTSCLGLLQETSWEECCDNVKEMLDQKGYDCDQFACALSSPICIIIREKAVVLWLQSSQPSYDPRQVTALKEAWKWSLGPALSRRAGLELRSGAYSPLLVSVTMEYSAETQELEILKTLSPRLFASRRQQSRRFAVEFTRRSVEQALDGASLAALRRLEGWGEGLPPPPAAARCSAVSATHAPVFLGGRYVKLSRKLPQTPWILEGKRIMESSVQEIIFAPLAKLFQIPAEEVDRRLKFQSAGREDVDVRCLRDGRPFAVEVSDPRRALTAAELQSACEEISASGSVQVRVLVPITKEQLSQLKQGEQTKTKTYEALCVKITNKITEDSTNKITKDSTTNITEDSTTKITEDSTTKITEDSTTKITEDSTTKITEDSTNKITEDSTTKITEDSTNKITKDSTTNITEDSTTKITEDSTTKITEDSTTKITEDSTTKITEDSTNKITEDSTTKITEDSTNKITKDSTNKQIRTVVTALPITAEDIARINAYRNTPPEDPARVVLSQKTPIRVLHRRPLLTRTRKILELSASEVKDQPLVFVVRLRTEAGTYIKEWVHGELGRTRPCLGDALGAKADILALDVAGIDLAWPPGI